MRLSSSSIHLFSWKMVFTALVVVSPMGLLAEESGLAAQPSSNAYSSESADPSAGQVRPPAAVCEPADLGSPFVPVDSWIYPAMFRLYGLGFVDHVFLGMRPWTRSSINRMLEDVAARIEDADPAPETDQAQELYEALAHELRFDMAGPCLAHQGNSRVESVYTVARAISGTPLRDSFHLGSTIINDYGRPFASGFNNYTGASGYASAGRFTLYVRGEFRGTPSDTGYSFPLAQSLASIDGTIAYDAVTGQPIYYPQATIPLGPIAKVTNARFLRSVCVRACAESRNFLWQAR